MSEATVGRDNFRWVTLGLISVSHIIGATTQYGINTLAPFYKDELGLSRAQVGLFFSAFYLAMAGFSFSAGRRADRLGVRSTTLQGHLSLGICTIAAAFAPSFLWAFASFFLAGVGYSFLNPASSKGVMEWFHRDERATAMGTKQTAVPGGGVLSAVLAPAVGVACGLARGSCRSGRYKLFIWLLVFFLLARSCGGSRGSGVRRRPGTRI